MPPSLILTILEWQIYALFPLPKKGHGRFIAKMASFEVVFVVYSPFFILTIRPAASPLTLNNSRRRQQL
jgi:hypothetical protein